MSFGRLGFCVVRCVPMGTSLVHVRVRTGAKGTWKQRQFLQTPVSLQLILSGDNHRILRVGRDLEDNLVQLAM